MQGFYLGVGDVLKTECIGEMRGILLVSRPAPDVLRSEHTDDGPVLDIPTFGFEIQKGQISDPTLGQGVGLSFRHRLERRFSGEH